MVYVWLALGFACLIYGGDMLVCGAVKLAKKMGVSPLLIGLTLVGFGTSTPELVTSLLAAHRGSAGIAVGNVVGSNIANILLVLGVAAVISPVKVDITAFKRDGAFLALSTLGVLAAVEIGKINTLMGVVLVAALIGYMIYSYLSDRKAQKSQSEPEEADSERGIVSFIKTVVGIALTLWGAKLLVDNAIILAEQWHISQAVIGLTIVAVGTSLPELITSVMSGIRGHNDVAFGNVVGSNIYNALFILGITALFIDVSVPAQMATDALIMAGTTLALIGIAFWKKEFSRAVGVVFLMAYALYVWMLFT